MLVFAIGLLPANMYQLNFLENEVYKYIILTVVIGISLALLILANLKYYFLQRKQQFTDNKLNVASK